MHYLRDNPNVPSDVEQMPNLLNFIKDNGTLLTNDHTILISHTGGGILSSLTGLYPDRHGQAVSNSYNFFRPDGTSGFSSTFKYWTDNTDGGNPANSPPTASADPNFNMVNADPASLGGTGAVRNAPAPWVPYTRAGCDVGNVGVANTVLENNTAIVFRSTPGADVAGGGGRDRGATNIKVDERQRSRGWPDPRDRERDANHELATIASVGTAGAAGTGVDLTAPLTKAHASGGQVNVDGAGPDRRHDEGLRRRLARVERGTRLADRAVRHRGPRPRPDRLRRDRHPLRGPGKGDGICTDNERREADVAPRRDRAATPATTALFGAKYVNPAINGGSPRSTTPSGQPIADPFGQPGFPGFDGMFAKNTLGEVAQMQENGVPVTFAYISDAHDFHGVSGNTHVAYGPGEAGYVQQLKDYDKAFGDFFTRLKNDGITKNNTLFVFTVEEGDHFAGTAPDAPCDGVTTPCTYANGHVTEVNGDLKRMVATYNASHGTSRDDRLQRPFGPGAERLHQRQPGPRLREGPQSRTGHVRHAGHQPAVGQDGERLRRHGRPRRGEAPPHGHGRPGADADGHAVRARGLLPQCGRRHANHVRQQRPVELRLPAQHDAAEPDVRLEPWRDPARDPDDLGRDHRPRRREEAARDRASGPTTRTCGRRCWHCSVSRTRM